MKQRAIRSLSTIAIGLLLGGAAQAQSTSINPALLQNLQLKTVQISNLQLNVKQVNQTTFNQLLQAPNAKQFSLQDQAALVVARDAKISQSLKLTSSLSNVPDLRADIARVTLKLPAGLTVPTTIKLRDGATKEILLYGQDTVALSVASAEANAAKNRADILQSFGLDEKNPVPKEFLQPQGNAATTVANARVTVPVSKTVTQINPNIVKLLLPDPSQPGKELGDGFSAHPSDGACRFTPTNAYFNQMKGTNINLITTIKDQAHRGTCGSFAYVSALESLIARKIKTRFNLSEQYAYYWMRSDDTVLGDGIGWGDYDDIIAKKRMIPTEVRWAYNPSWNRIRIPSDNKKPITEFQHSCDNYTQACSDTTPQAQVFCLLGNSFCVWLPNWQIAENAAFNFRPTQGNEIWHSLGAMSFSDPNVTRAYRRQMMRQMLDRGDQLILGFGVDAAFDAIGANGQPNMSLMGTGYRGGHAVHLIGYVNTGKQTFNNVKYKIGPFETSLGSMTFDTGVWVIKNSWSCGFGDGGYAYLPDNFLDTEANGVYNLRAGAVASDMAGF